MTELVSNGNFSSPTIVVSSNLIPPTSWSFNTGNGGLINFSYAYSGGSTYSKLNLPSIPSVLYTQCAYINYSSSSSSSLRQSISCSTAGNYFVSFYTAFNPAGIISSAISPLTFTVGSELSKTITYGNSSYNGSNVPWKKYSFYFTVSTTGAKNLTFSTSATTVSGITNLWVTGVSVMYLTSNYKISGYPVNYSYQYMYNVLTTVKNNFNTAYPGGLNITTAPTADSFDISLNELSYFSYNSTNIGKYCIPLQYVEFDYSVNNVPLNAPPWCTKIKAVAIGGGGGGGGGGSGGGRFHYRFSGDRFSDFGKSTFGGGGGVGEEEGGIQFQE